MNCININHFEVIKLADQFDLHPAIVAAKIGVWQTHKGITDRFPTPDEFYGLIGPVVITSSDLASRIIPITKAQFFKELGRAVPKSQISDAQAQIIMKQIGIKNNEYARKDINKVLRFERKQVGQSDNFTWKVWQEKGRLDTAAKQERQQAANYDANRLPSPTSISPEFVAYKNEKAIKYGLKASFILASQQAIDWFKKADKNQWRDDVFWNKLNQDLQIPKEQVEILKSLQVENPYNRENLLTSLLADYSYTIEINTVKKSLPGPEAHGLGVMISYQKRVEELGEGGMKLDDAIAQAREEFNISSIEVNSDNYANMTVLGGINYTENEIKIPGITPSIQGHAGFSTSEGMGWFRSDEQAHYPDENRFVGKNELISNSKSRRILEVQSDLFQKGRNIDFLTNERKGLGPEINHEKNNFLQLLNKDNNWVSFFIKSIMQDSAKKGYEKVLFPLGDTISKIEGHTTLEEFRRHKEDRLNNLNNVVFDIKEGTKEGFLADEPALDENGNFIKEWRVYRLGYTDELIAIKPTKEEAQLVLQQEKKNVLNEINQIKLELKRAETEGFAALRPIYKFYDETITNILKKQGFKPTKTTDEHGNDWNEVLIDPKHATEFIAFKNLGRSDTYLSAEDTRKNYSQEMIRKYADALKTQLGVDYQTITPEEAADITKGSPNPWNGQSAFFYKDSVYFVGSAITPDDVLHEFVHPLLRAISKQNRELFDNLYAKLTTTQEGAKILEDMRQLYPNLDESSDLFKEEALVRGLTAIQDLNNQGLESTDAFRKFIDNLLYAIRKVLRKVFGSGIKAETINPSTTLEQLSDILKEGGVFQLDPEIMSDKEMVTYKEDYDRSLRGFVAQNANAKEIEDLVNDFYKKAAKGLYNVSHRPDLGELADILKNRLKTGALETIKSNLSSYQTLLLEHTKDLEDEVELTRQRVVAAVNSLGTVDNMTQQIHEAMQNILKDINDPDNVQKALYFQKVMNYWGGFVNQAYETLEANGVKNIKAISSINDNIRRTESLLDKFYEKATHKALWSTIKGTAENIDQKWQSRINELKAKKASAKVIAEAEKEYAEEKLTPEKLSQALQGKLKDVNMAGAFLESYAYNPDPVVGGLATYMLQEYSKMEVKAQARYNEMAIQLKPLLDDADINMNKPAESGERLGFIETVGVVDENTGELTEKKVWRFLNQFQGADLARAQYLSKIRQASLKYHETGSLQDKQTLADTQSEWEQHRRKYFHTEFTEEFYKAQDLFKKDEIGKEARMAMNDVYDRLNQVSGQIAAASSEDVLEAIEQAEAIQRELRQLSSLYDAVGQPKIGREFDIAERIQQYQEASRDMYESLEIPGAFQAAYSAYEQKLLDEGKKAGDPRFQELMDRWLDKNTRIKVTDEFWQERKEIYEDIAELMKRIPNQGKLTEKVEEDSKLIQDLLKASRDESGQPQGTEMTPEKQQRIHDAEERLSAAREQLNNLSGLTKQESDEMHTLLAKNARSGLTNDEQLRLSRLFDKQRSMGLDSVERAELFSLFNELDELQYKLPTDAYVDTFNDLLAAMDPTVVYSIFNKYELEAEDLTVINDIDIQQLMRASPDFEDWFIRNHTSKNSFSYETAEDYTTWRRTAAWSVIRPLQDKHYEHSSVKDLNGNAVPIKAVPSMRYYKKLLKDSYRVKQEVGVNADNRGRWLPRTAAQGAPDDRYINKDYERLKQSDPSTFKLLEKMKQLHVENQVGLPDRQKLWMDMPRYEKRGVEKLQSGNLLKRLIYKAKTFWQKARDSWDHGFNFEDTKQLITVDMFDDDTSGIPISGLSDIPVDEVSTDAIYTMLRYSYSAERSRTLHKISPVARATQQVLNNERNSPLYQRMLKNNTIVNPNRRKDQYMRAKAVNNLVERMLEGVENKGWGSDNPAIQNFSNLLFKSASGAFLNLNIPSAIKNAVSAKFQGMIESSAGKHMRWKDFIAAEYDASQVTFEIMTEIYKSEPKSLGFQMVEIFDPERDRFAHSYGESLTRTVQKDYTWGILGRMNDFRRTTQLQSNIQVLYGMLRTQRILLSDGSNIMYKDAWEINKDGKIQTKASVPAEWGITYDKDGNQVVGKKFIEKRLEFQRVSDNLNGAMSREFRPEADRYLAFRYISFFRRFLTSMLVNRFAVNRYDYSLSNTKQGWYITFANLLWDSIRNGGKNLPYMKAEEKAAFMRVMTELGTLMLIYSLLIPYLFGFDPEDKDRFKKLKAKSDALQIPGITIDDKGRPFSFGGWVSNHALYQLLAFKTENDQFLPWPGLGLGNYKDMLDIKAVVFGPTLSSGSDVINDLWYMTTGNEKARYQKRIGAYRWQDEDSLKLWNHLGKILGLSSSNLDPVIAIRNAQMSDH